MEAPDFTLRWAGRTLKLGERTHVMGVVNVTPDSFSDGGLFLRKEKAIECGLAMAEEGVDIIDIGGESTRPYSEKVSVDQELERVIPVVKGLSSRVDVLISIDTYKAEVAREALQAGASIINDISALRFDKEMASVAAEAGVPVVLMHMKGTPDQMQDNPAYKDLMQEIINFLAERIDHAVNSGINRQLIIIDPGIGFGKTFDHNLEIIKHLTELEILKRPILLGSSRKAFIGEILQKDVTRRDAGTMATVAAGILNGADIVRVHNVKETMDTVKVIDAIKRGKVA
jgi:dihydropteroate synthase